MKEHVSALMDSELGDDEGSGCVRRLKTDAALRESWEIYHLIGDTLRGSAAAGLPTRFHERLASEPTVLAPQRSATTRSRPSRYVWSAAASVAAVAFVGWMAAPLFESPVQTAAVAPVQAAAVQPAAVVVPAAQGVGDYLLAHQRYSPRSVMAGVASYVQSVQENGNR